jgi:hypothetical protein
MTLDDFIERNKTNPYLRNQWVREKGFAELYVRIAMRCIEDRWVRCIDISNVRAQYPGKGAFTALVKKLQGKYPELWIYVECVLDDRFRGKLLRDGFIQNTFDGPPSFYLKGTAVGTPVAEVGV